MGDAGIYPAIDIESSVSRAMTSFISEGQQQLVTRFRQIYSTYQENRDLVAVGAYQPGSNPQLDEAIALWPSIIKFLRQHHDQSFDTAASLAHLRELFTASETQGQEGQDMTQQ